MEEAHANTQFGFVSKLVKACLICPASPLSRNGGAPIQTTAARKLPTGY